MANSLYADVQFVMYDMPEKVCGPADTFDLEYTEFGLKLLEKFLAEVWRERRLYSRYLSEARSRSAGRL